MAFSKRNRAQAQELISNILNKQRQEIIIVRAADCELLYYNEPAAQRLDAPEKVDIIRENCKLGYSRSFEGLCGQCLGQEEARAIGMQHQCEVKDKTGRVYAANRVTFNWLDDKPATAWFLQDIDEMRSAESKLYKLAYTDVLTGAPNRQKYKEDFAALEERMEKESVRGVLALFDLDNFKAVNDTYGHNAGDVMLRRLAEHIGADPVFRGKLYRLGGDEFILLFSDVGNPYGSEEAYRKHYETLLSGALLSYTLPNIDVSCTISMGVALFPQHGGNSSEVLRKADIALYQSKDNGRNRISFFEEQFDEGRKLKDIYVNIQPILTPLDRTFGYELIDRGEHDEQEGENALSLSEFNHTTDALVLEDIENDLRYLIGYTEQLNNPDVRKYLPKDKFIIQYRLPDHCTENEQQLLKRLKGYGYSLLLAGIKASNAIPALMAYADYCKFAPGALPEELQKRMIAQYKNKRFIAEAINTHEAFVSAKARGFKLFQGFYFNQPAITKKTTKIDPLKVNYFRLLKMANTTDYVDFKEISNIISSDLALSYKLLRLLNSAAVGLRYHVSSISMAVAYLGEENLKKWISLLALRGVAFDKPSELIRLSMIRARFGELLMPYLRPRRNPKHIFLTGMLSLLHVAMDRTCEELLDEMPVAEEIRQSLLTKNGVYSNVLSFFSSYEYSNWEEVNRFADENSLSCQTINDCYIEAVKWYNDLISET